MNLDSTAFALTQVEIVIKSLVRDNSNVHEVWSCLSDLLQVYGRPVERWFLRCLISLLVQEETLKSSELVESIRTILLDNYRLTFSNPLVCSALCQCLRKVKQTPQLFVSRLTSTLGLPLIQQVRCAIILECEPFGPLPTFEPNSSNNRQEFAKEKVLEFFDKCVSSDILKSDSNLDDLHAVLVYACEHDCKLKSERQPLFIEKLKVLFPSTNCPLKISQYIYSEEPEPQLDTTMDQDLSNSGPSANGGTNPPVVFDPDVVKFVLDYGPSICTSVEECRATLSTVSPHKLTPAAIIRIMVGMVKACDHAPNSMWGDSTTNGLKDHTESSVWNGKVFVQAVLELAPSLDWKDVFREMDFPGFYLKDNKSYRSLMEALKHGLQIQGQTRPEQFPLESLFRRWHNKDGQMMLLKCCLNPSNYDVFWPLDYPCKTTNTDMLKITDKAYELKEILIWKCSPILELLLNLSDNGHFQTVQEMFQFPVNHCPDILFVGLIQLSCAMNVLRQELLSALFPLFLGNHVNSAQALQHAWTAPNGTMRPMMTHAMAEWYLRSDFDQTKLTRILDVAQDLKALPNLLNANSHLFIVDLACLASRREFLKLDKWLSDKIREHGEPFVASLIKVLNRRAPYLFGKDESIPKNMQLPPETVNTMIQSLHQCVGKVSQDLEGTIHSILTAYNILLNKSRSAPGSQPPPGVGVMRPPHRNPMEAFNNMNPSPTPGNLFGQNDLLGSTLASLNISGATGNATSSASAFGLGGIGAPTPGSPSRPLGPNFPAPNPSTTSFSMLSGVPLGHNSSTPSSSIGSSMLGSIGGPMGLVGGGRLGTSQPSTTAVPNSIPSGSIGDKRNVNPDPSLLFSEMQTNDISKEAEEEANQYFHRIYSKPPDPSMSPEEVLELLKKFKDSAIRKEREIFICMLKNLFDEYKFFAQYPEKELHITAQLFGGIIEHGLVSTFLQLGVALRFVVDALKKTPGSKMYCFGIAALDRFKSRLKEYPQYCQHVSSIAHFREFPPHLIEFVECGQKSLDPPNTRALSAAGNILPPAASSAPGANKPSSITTSAVSKPPSATPIGGRPSIASSTNISTLLVATEKIEKVKVPPDTIQDKTAFIFNNLNQMNLSQKCEELKEVLGKDYWPWIAQYLVMKRASIELNFHTLYANLLDQLGSKELYKAALRETYRNIRTLLKADKSVGNFSDRALLKNLGHWLGMITVMKNKPIVMDDLEIKSLIIEAYHKGVQDLLYVVPFAAKIMESCARSIIFKPPCPWTMQIMGVLAELHSEPEIKLNLKFEIEVLCKALNLEIGSLKRTHILRNEAYKVSTRLQLNHESEKVQVLEQAKPVIKSEPLHQSSAPTPLPQQPGEDLTGPSNNPPSPSAGGLNQHGLSYSVVGPTSSTPTLPATAPEPKFSYAEVDTGNLGSLMSHIQISSSLQLLQSNPNLKQYVRQAVEKAIQDLLLPVVDRSIKYTINACEHIIKKDFALDPEESRMRIAAHHMMRYLTAGMAMITSRDHIFHAINNNLKTTFSTSVRNYSTSPQIKELVEQTCSTIANDNMEIACVFIQKAAVEKALMEIDKRLAAEYEIRKQAKLEGRMYCDQSSMAYQMDRMPEIIRVKPASQVPLSQQLAVYEDFSRNIPGFTSPSEGDMHLFANQKIHPAVQPPIAPTNSSSGGAAVNSFMPNQPPSSGPNNANALPQVPVPGNDSEHVAIYDKLTAEMENYLQGLAMSSSPASPQLAAGLRNLLEAIVYTRNNKSGVVAAIALLQKAVEGLLEGLATFPTDPEIIRYRDAHLMVLKALQDPRAFGQQWVNRQVTKCLIECRPEFKYNIEGVDTLIRASLVNMLQFDAHLAGAMDKGTNLMAVNFAMRLVQMYLVDERFSGTVPESDLYHTVDMLVRISSLNRQHPEGLLRLIELLRSFHDHSSVPNANANSALGGLVADRAAGGPSAVVPQHLPPGQTREFEDSQQGSQLLFREWIRLYLTQGSVRDSTKAFNLFMLELSNTAVLKSDDALTRFFRVCVQCCISQTYQGMQSGSISLVRSKCYQSVDALVRLVVLLIKNIGDNTSIHTKVNLLNKFLGIVAGLLIQDHDHQKSDFQQLPFHRIFIMLFQDLSATDPVFDSISLQVLSGFSNILHIINPSKVPGFAYSWLEIIGNRLFMAKMVALASDMKSWSLYCQLLLDLFKFMLPFLRNAELAKPVASLYRGALRILLVLLHDFPDFLCDYCYHFLDAIPPNCIQMRNLVLSAFPRNMRLPDPFTANLKFEMLPEHAVAPRIISNVGNVIQPAKFKQDMDSYLKTRAPVTFLSELRTNLQVTNEAGTRYNIPLMNALVLYVGSQHIQAIRQKGQTPNMSTIAHTSHMDIFQNMAVDLDTEGRYLFLNGLANQLRFPSSHTHYFSLVILYLFAQSNTEVVQEQITRVLLERLVVNRPHPWGLLVTFIELLKNPSYKFWQHEFVHCAPEVEKLFESVAKSCPNGPSIVALENSPDLLID